MATTLDVIRTLTIKAKQEGVAEAKTGVAGLADVVDTSGKRALSVEKNFAALERRFVTGAKEIQDFEKIQRMLNMAVGQFPQLLDQANRILDAAATKLLGASNATSKLTAAMSENVMASKAMTAGMTAAGQAADKTANSVKTAGEASAAASKQIVAGMSSIGAKALESSVATEKLTAGLSQAGKDAAAIKPFDRLIQGMTDATNASKVMIQGMSAVGTEAAKTSATTNKFGDATKGARYEMLNLSRQIQDVVVSAQSGQGLFTILVQQGSQVADIFQTAAASGRNFGATLLALITPLSVAVTSILAIGAAAVTAAFQWVQAQKAIQQSLLGIGRASGVTASQINQIAESAKELSTSEAGQFASTLAATGKIGVDVMKELTNVAKDTSRVLGVDLDETAKILAKDFSNLETGVDDLNGRLGSFNAKTAENIKNLIAQGNNLGAQKAALEGLKSGLEGVNNVVTNSSRGWTALGNSISNTWSALGEFVATAAGLGPALDLQTQAAALETQIARVIDRLEKINDVKIREIVEAQLGALQNKLIEVQNELAKTGAKANQTAENIASAFQKKQIDAVMPELIKKQDSDNAIKAMEDIVEGLLSGRIEADGMTRSLTQAVQALGILKALAGDIGSAFKQASESLDIAAKEAVAITPSAKAEVVYLRELNSLRNAGMDQKQREALADKAKANFLAKLATEESQAAKMRKLSAEQAVESAKLEASLVGKSAGQQAVLRANLEAKQKLQQDAASKGTEYNKAELAEIEKINAGLGVQADLRVKNNLQKDIARETKLLGLTDEDAQIAERLKEMYPNITEAINSAEAAQLRLNNRIKDAKDLTGDFLNTFVQGMLRGEDATKALGSALKNLGSSLVSSGIKNMSDQLVGSLGDSLKSLTGLGSLGGPAGAAIGVGVSLLVDLFDTSKQQAEQKAAAEAAANAMNQANDSLKSVTDSFNQLTDVANGAVTAMIKNAKQQFDNLKTSAEASRAAALIVVNTPGNTPAVMAQANANIAAANRAVVDATQKLADYNLRVINDALEGFVTEDLSPIAQGIKDLQDKAKDLEEAMVLAGRSAGEAAEIVGKKLTEALAKLADKINNDLLRKINELSGKGYFNQVADLLKEIADAQAGGANADTIAEYFRKAAQSIIDGAKLTGDAYQELIKKFPELAAVTHEYGTVVNDTTDTIKRSAEELEKASDSLAERMFAVTENTNNLTDTLARFDRDAQREREAETRAGGENLVELERVLAAEREQVIKEFNDRVMQQTNSLLDRLLAATVDSNTLEGKLALFDRAAQREREAEIAAGGHNLALLEQTLAAERAKIVKDWYDKIAQDEKEAADKIIEEQKRAEEERLETIKRANEEIIAYLNGLLTSSLSPLSAKAQLDEARRLYEQQLALAQSGDLTALQNITKSADTLLNASKAFYGSSAGYQRDFTAIQSQLGSLAGGNTGTLSSANDNVAAISAAGFATTIEVLREIAGILASGVSSTDAVSAAIFSQTELLNQETRFAERK